MADTPKHGVHGRQRLLERYGIDLGPEAWGALIIRLVKGDGLLLANRDSGLERRLVTIDGKEVVLMWNPVSRRIVTVYPKRLALPKMKRSRRNGREGRRPEP